MHDIRMIPLDQIDDTALLRDRSVLDAEALAELTGSIRHHGLRLPIEVIPNEDGRDRPFALLSGLRRITACREIAEDSAPDSDLHAIPAIVREAMEPAAALAAVIEENEMRESLSPWEKGRIVLMAYEAEYFDTVEAAASALFPAAGKAKLSRIRGIARVVEALEDLATDPELWSLRQCLRVAAAIRAGFGPVIRAALEEEEGLPRDVQWRLILPYLEEAEGLAEDQKPIRLRPKRLSKPKYGLSVRREKTPVGWSLHFSGRLATDLLTDRVFDEIERMFGPPQE